MIIRLPVLQSDAILGAMRAVALAHGDVTDADRRKDAARTGGRGRAVLPYRERDDPALEARYRTLGDLPADTFGSAFRDHFNRNGFAFPGNANALAEGFTSPPTGTSGTQPRCRSTNCAAATAFPR
jgi:hypothetical protein